MIDLSRNSRRWQLLPGLAVLVLSSLLYGQEVSGPADRLRAADPVPGSALNFNALRLEIPNEGAINFEVGSSFTIEGWFRIEAFKSSGELFVGKEGSYLIRRDGSSGRLEFATARNSFSYDELTTSSAVPLKEWFHLAAVYDGGSATKRLYLDGVLQGEQVIGNIQPTNFAFVIGGSALAGTSVNASIDGLRLWGSARNADELLADMDRDLTVFDSGTSAADRVIGSLLAEWRFNDVFNGTLRDSSGAPLRNASVGMGPVNADRFVDGLAFRPAPPLASVERSALNFDGSADSRVAVANQDLLNPTNGITLEAWIQIGAFDRPWQAIVTKGNAWGLSRFEDTSRITFQTSEMGTVDDLAGATELLPERWYHVAGTWDGGVKRLYIDGILDAAAEWSGPLDVALEGLLIGDQSTSNRSFVGSIDNVRLWARARSGAQIETGRWSNLRGFENGLRGDWRFDEPSGTAAVDSSYLEATGMLGAAVARVDGLTQAPLTDPVASVPPPAGGALYFPSDLTSKSSVVLPKDDRFELHEAMTVEAWVSLSAYANKPQGVVTKGGSWALVVDPQTGLLNFQTRRGSEQVALRTSTPLGLDDWHHIAAVFDGSTKRLYVDGELVASADFVGTLMENPLETVAFSGNSDTTSGQVSMRGRLDSVRIWSDSRSQDEIQRESQRELRGTEQGLVGVWRFEDGVLGNDSSWNRLHGKLGGKPAIPVPFSVKGLPFTSPPDGALALDFNRDLGDKDCVTLGVVDAFNFSSQMSLETWVQIVAVPPEGESYALVSKGSGAWELLLEANGKLNFRTSGVVLQGTTDPTEDLLSTNRIEPDEWYHVAVVWNGATGTKELHINGQLDASRNDLAGEISGNAFPVVLGARPLDAGLVNENSYYRGILDELRIWKVALQGAQIRATFDNKLFGSELGLVGYWPFSQGGRDESGMESMTALDQAEDPRVAIDGVFCPGMGILNRVEGVQLGSPDPLQYALYFNGTDGYVEVPTDASFTSGGGSLTIEAWILPQGNGLRTIVMQGDLGFGLAIDDENRLRYFDNGNPLNSPASTDSVSEEVWQHVAVVVDGAVGKTTFYINGLPAGSLDEAQVNVKPGQPLIIGKLGPYGGSYFQGYLDEVRVWTSARTPTEMEFFALQPLPPGDPAGLVAYWQLNEGRDVIAGNSVSGSPSGTLINMDDSNWISGHFFSSGTIDPSLNLSPVQGSQGLWIGTIVLDRVNEVQTAIGGESEEPTPTGDTLTVRILLHADDSGAVSLLKDVIVMRTPQSAGLPRKLALVTDPLLIPQFEGIVERGGKYVGQRFGTVDYEFNGNELSILGGIGPGSGVAGRITLSASHPNNPFRHKYHPQHRDGFAIARQFGLSFDTVPEGPASSRPGFGSDWISGTYQETISGLHKIPLKTSGRFNLTRINEVGSLNE